MRVVASQTLNIPNGEIVFERGEWGKPRLWGHPDFHYNISHTRSAVMVAVSDSPVGADIEKIKKAELGIAKRYFAEQEQDYIAISEEGAAERFYEIWTRKEAYGVSTLAKACRFPFALLMSPDRRFALRL